MKLLIVTSLKEYKGEVFRIFGEGGVSIYSTTDITGVKQGAPPDLLQEWFAAGDEKFDSVMTFSFTTDEKARVVKELIENYNRRVEDPFPIRAFIIPIEDATL